jgi:hypothetical protein
MFIVISLISSIIIAILEYLLSLLGFSFHNFFPGIIFPVGAIIDGFLCSVGSYAYLRSINKNNKYYHIVFSIIFSIMTFFLIYYISYLTSYISGNNENHLLHGTHISNFLFNNSEPFNFITYIKYSFSNMETVGHYSSIVISKKPIGNTLGTIMFLLELIGFIFGSILSSFIVIQLRDNCKKCKTILGKKKLYKFNPDDFEVEVNGIQNSISSKKNLSIYISNRRNIDLSMPFYEVIGKYCTNCHISFIEFIFKYRKRKNNGEEIIVEDKEKYKTIQVPYDTI